MQYQNRLSGTPILQCESLFYFKTCSTEPTSQPTLALLGALEYFLVERIRSAGNFLAGLLLCRVELSSSLLTVGVELRVDLVGFGLGFVAL
jgi:hypothetical protein